jgi:hypothetical protein
MANQLHEPFPPIPVGKPCSENFPNAQTANQMIDPRKILHFTILSLLAAVLFSCSGRHHPSPEQITAAVFKDARLTSCATWIGGCPWRDSAALYFYASRINQYLGEGGVAEEYSHASVGISDEGYVDVLFWTRTWSGKYRLNSFNQAVGHVRPCKDLSSSRAHELAKAFSTEFDSSYSTSLGIFIDGESAQRAVPENPRWWKKFGPLPECDQEDE